MARATKYGEHRLQVVMHIQSAALAHSRPPTVRTLADALGVGVATMHSYLGKLAEEGLVEWQPKSHRSIRCTPLGIQALMSQAMQPV